MRRGGAGLLAVVLALAGCKTTDPKPTDKKADREPAGTAASRTKGKGLAWLDDMNRQPGAGTAVPKADSWADPKDPGFNVSTEVKGVLAGRVIDPAGRGAKNVYIRIEPADARAARGNSGATGAEVGIMTDASGYFMTKGLKPGQAYHLTAEASWEGKQVYGVAQTKTPNATLVIPLREDVGLPPPGPPRGGNTAPPAGTPASPAPGLPPPAELIPQTEMPTTPAPVPGSSEQNWKPGAGATNRAVPPSLPAPGGGPAPGLPPPNPVDVPRATNPERTADTPRDPRWPPPVSIPSPVLPPSPPVPPLPPPPKDTDGKTTSRPRRPAGNFTLLDSLERPWDFASSRSGSLVLLDFMTTTCGPCKQVIPALTEMQSRYGAAGLEVIAVCCDEGAVAERIARARKYHQDYGLNYSLYVEPGNAPGQVRDRFGVEVYPTVVLLDAAGAVVWKGHPGTRRAELEDAIRRNLGK